MCIPVSAVTDRLFTRFHPMAQHERSLRRRHRRIVSPPIHRARLRHKIYNLGSLSVLAPLVRLNTRHHKQHKMRNSHGAHKRNQRLQQGEILRGFGTRGEVVVLIVVAQVLVGGVLVAILVRGRADSVVGEGVRQADGERGGTEGGQDPEDQVHGDVGTWVDGPVGAPAEKAGEDLGCLPDNGESGLGARR